MSNLLSNAENRGSSLRKKKEEMAMKGSRKLSFSPFLVWVWKEADLGRS